MVDDSNNKVLLGGLARKLIQVGLLSETIALQATIEANKAQLNFVSYIVANNIAKAYDIAVIAANEFGLPLFDLDVFDSQFTPVQMIKPGLMHKTHSLPLFKRGNRLFVALSDPTNFQAIEDIKFQTMTSPEAIIVEEDKLAMAIERVTSAHEISALGNLEELGLDSLELSGDDTLLIDEANPEFDAPVVKFVNKVLIEAVNKGASDIHFEPFERTFRIRFRQDGILYEYNQPPVNLGNRISSRLKVISQLDIAERRLPQDGRFKMRISQHRTIDFRVSSCPTLFGEKIMMRILDPSSTQLGIDGLGYEEFQKKIFLNAIHKPQGMVLVTGPTGSGKTVSLYTALHILNTIENNISTCEDPVEINLPGVNQVNINNKAGLTFATVLRAFLRQDPDIIMVGEIRDLETAEIAIKAAQTGHMVLSTIHTNSAADTLTRLINMGIPAYNIATSVSLVIASRLARRLCSHCKVVLNIPEPALLESGLKKDELKDLVVYGPKGCERCKEGYKGRIGIYEVMPISAEIGRIIMSGGNSLHVAEQANLEGTWTLRRTALHKFKMGITSLEEVNRVTKD
ncbi:MAG: type pilus assembly ATPase PilB [Francisellaceae bacterium]|nr:type pilus assembly ATPase PilB [Francisellaceae bacterium]